MAPPPRVKLCVAALVAGVACASTAGGLAGSGRPAAGASAAPPAQAGGYGVLVTFYGGSQRSLRGTPMEATKKEYAERWGMRYFDATPLLEKAQAETEAGHGDKNVKVFKYIAMREALRDRKAAYAWWVDADTLIKNMAFDVASLFPASGGDKHAVFTANAMRNKAFGHVNTGAFLVANTVHGRSLLRELLGFKGGPACADGSYQTCDQALYNCFVQTRPEWLRRIGTVGTSCMNSEWPWVYGKSDLVVHFAGGKVQDKLERMEEELGKRPSRKPTEPCVTDQRYWVDSRPPGKPTLDAFFNARPA